MHRGANVTSRSMRTEAERQLRSATHELGSRVVELGLASLAPGPELAVRIRELALAAEGRGPETTRHLHRMSRYSALIARGLGWSDDRCELLHLASQLHDIGKIGISAKVLMKEGAFTLEDRKEMERHAAIGHDLLSRSTSPVLDLGAVVALSHHERVDGAGYPKRLRGDGIPIEGRIVAIADVFDALTSVRRYKRAMNVSQARALMSASRGSHFDALLLDCFFDHLAEVEQIRHERPEQSAHGT